ncbi:hypothetical protein GCM10023082_44490 [Streptomyces tremellae]|uniref:Uncharacterized protein n=1 Tax=Streptomyces tremellae TaxID=1124239 RepID=A0ABP7FMP5_9ACTN
MNLAIGAGRGILPGPDAPVFAPHLIVEGYTGPAVRYSDSVWPMGPDERQPQCGRRGDLLRALTPNPEHGLCGWCQRSWCGVEGVLEGDW